MNAKVGNQKFSHFGTEYEKLYNNRYALERRYISSDNNEAPMARFANGEFFEPFGSLDGAPHGQSPVTTVPPGFRFENLVLVRQFSTFLPSIPFPVFIKRYETVTNTFQDTEGPVKSTVGTNIEAWTYNQIGSPTAQFSGIVGQTTKVIDGKTFTLAEVVETDRTEAFVRIRARYEGAGILSATKEFTKDGLLYVTFVSQGTRVGPTALVSGKTLLDPETEAFQGGASATIFRSRTENPEGFRRFSVTVVLNRDGSPLAAGDNKVLDYETWQPYNKPGLLAVDSNGIQTVPGPQRQVKVRVEVFLSTDRTIDDTFKPYSVVNWASLQAAYTPEASGVRQFVYRGGEGYLANSSGSGSNTSFWGQQVTSFAFAAASNPTPTAFNAINNAILAGDSSVAFVTDLGVTYYRKVRVTVLGTFGTYLAT